MGELQGSRLTELRIDIGGRCRISFLDDGRDVCQGIALGLQEGEKHEAGTIGRVRLKFCLLRVKGLLVGGEGFFAFPWEHGIAVSELEPVEAVVGVQNGRLTGKGDGCGGIGLDAKDGGHV